MFLSAASRAWCATAGSAQGGCIPTAGIANRIQLEGWMLAAERSGVTLMIAHFRHKGLRHLFEEENAKGVPSAMADKLRKLLFALETAEMLEQLGRFPGWKLHPLKGDLKGSWSLTVTGNWRLIFRYDEQTNTASDIDLIDYH